MQNFSVGACFRFAWTTFKQRPWFFIGMTAFIFVLSAVPSFVRSLFSKAGGGVLDVIGFLISLGISFLVAFAQAHFFLRAHDSVTEVRFGDLWTLRGFGSFCLLKILLSIIFIVSFLLLIVPGIILSIVLMFSIYVYVDKNIKPIESMKESARLTKGHRWTLLWFSIELLLLNLLGALALLVGLLVTVPVSILATIHAYRTLQENPKLS